MATYGQHTEEMTRAMAGIVARPGARYTPADLPVVLGCRDAVVSAVSDTYRRLSHSNPHYPATLSGLETNPVDVLGGLMSRYPRMASSRSPTQRAEHVSDNPMTQRWQHAAQAATLASHRADDAGMVWRRDPTTAWKGVADLAALAQALPWADEDLAAAASAAGWADHAHALRAAARSGVTAAAPTVEALARSGPLSDEADRATGTPSLTPSPVRRVSDLEPAQHKVAAQLRGAARGPSLHVVTTVATGQARAAGAAADVLGADPANRGVASALRDRADNLTEIAAARTRISSIYPGRGDIRAALQTGEVMRGLESAGGPRSAEEANRVTPHLLGAAAAGSDVVTALDETVTAAVRRGDYVVPSEGWRTTWQPASQGERPALLDAVHKAAARDEGVSREITSAYERVAAPTAATRPSASRAAADLTHTIATRQAAAEFARPASPYAPGTRTWRTPTSGEEHERGH